MKKSMYFIFAVLLFVIPANSSGRKYHVQQNRSDNVYLLTDDNFEKTIKDGIVLVDFWATWCGPCRILSPTIEEIASETGKKAIIAKMDVDKNKITAYKYNIQYLPTVIIFKNGKPEYRFVGLQEKETYVNAINNLQ
mgnify:CR=1 FL=1